MDPALLKRVEMNIERGASVLFAAAVGYAGYRWLSASTHQPVLGAYTGAIAALAYLVPARGLRAVKPAKPCYRVPVFDLRQMDLSAIEELLLTDEDRLQTPAQNALGAEPLVLDDILAEIGPNSRVVRLFDPSAMPTAGQLNARIERHLGKDVPQSAPEDASQALHEALAELRRSLG